jgi:tol-pal system protein YbgF
VKLARLAHALLVIGTVSLPGCAKHADFIEIRDQLSTVSRTQEQDHQRVDQALRRLESLEQKKDKEAEVARPRFDELSARLQKLETRLSKLEEATGQVAAKPEVPAGELAKGARPAKPGLPTQPSEATTIVPGVPAITPTSAFNLAYNDYLNGKYELAVSGFQRFIKDFPGTSLTPNAHYWLGECYYAQKDYPKAIPAFEHLISEYPGNEKMSAALYKLGLAAAEVGDSGKAKKSLKRVIEEFPASDEAKLAKTRLAEMK